MRYMLTLILLGLCFESPISENEEEYYVHAVKGRVWIAKDSTKIKSKQVLKASEEIVFENDSAMVSVTSTVGGYFIIKQKPNVSKRHKIRYIISNVLLAVKQQTTPRGDVFENYADLLSQGRLLDIDTIRLPPLSPFESGRLIMIDQFENIIDSIDVKGGLVESDKIRTAEPVRLMYCRGSQKETCKIITSISLKQHDLEQLKGELNFLCSSFSKMSSVDIDLLQKYVADHYGYISKKHISQILNAED